MWKQQGHRSVRAGQACKSPCHGLFAPVILCLLLGFAGPANAQDQTLQLAALQLQSGMPAVTSAVSPDSAAGQTDGPADEVRTYRVDG